MRIDLHLNFNFKCTKNSFTTQNTPDFDPSSLATIDTWEAETWYALLCCIDLEPHKVSARTDLIYEMRILLWAYKQYGDPVLHFDELRLVLVALHREGRTEEALSQQRTR